MATRINTPLTNEHFVAFITKMIGQPYWYGTCMYKCTEDLRARKAKSYPSHYGSGRTARYRQDIANKKVAADCIGASKGYAWTGGGIGVLESIGTDKTYTSKYGSNGCPDKSANGMFEYAKSIKMPWGTISTLPEVPGVAVRYDGHVGYYIGGGYAVEWRGFAYGCVKTKVADRKWLHWYALPYIDYGDADFGKSGQPSNATTNTLGSRVLRSGMSGADVKTLQQYLIQLGISCGSAGADGQFGSGTENAVKNFQVRYGLAVDGIYGAASHAAMVSAIGQTGKHVKIINGNCWIRSAAGTNGTQLKVASKGDIFDYAGETSSDGWNKIKFDGKTGWVSGKYSKLEG